MNFTDHGVDVASGVEDGIGNDTAVTLDLSCLHSFICKQQQESK